MPEYSMSDMVIGGSTPVPKNRYTVRLLELTVKTGQKVGAKPTLRVKAEIVDPPTIEHAGTKYKVAGRQFFFMPNSIDPSEEWGLGRIGAALQRANVDLEKYFGAPNKINTDKFHNLTGLCVDMVLDSKEEFLTREPNAEEIAQGITDPVNITDVNGNPYKKGWAIVDDAAKRAPVSPGWDQVVGPASAEYNGQP